jgi:hypothetical protein
MRAASCRPSPSRCCAARRGSPRASARPPAAQGARRHPRQARPPRHRHPWAGRCSTRLWRAPATTSTSDASRGRPVRELSLANRRARRCSLQRDARPRDQCRGGDIRRDCGHRAASRCRRVRCRWRGASGDHESVRQGERVSWSGGVERASALRFAAAMCWWSELAGARGSCRCGRASARRLTLTWDRTVAAASWRCTAAAAMRAIAQDATCISTASRPDGIAPGRAVEQPGR